MVLADTRRALCSEGAGIRLVLGVAFCQMLSKDKGFALGIKPGWELVCQGASFKAALSLYCLCSLLSPLLLQTVE